MSATTLPQTITIWKPTDNDGAGGITWVEPVAVPGRSADFIEQVKTAEGKVFTSKRVFYTEQNVELGDYIVISDKSALPAPSDDALEVKFVSHNPTMSTLYKAVV